MKLGKPERAPQRLVSASDEACLVLDETQCDEAADGAAIESSLASCEADLMLHSKLLDAAIDAIIAYTPDGTLVYANAAARARWDGVTLEQIRAAGPFGWIPVERRARARERAARVCIDGELRFESRINEPSGEAISLEVHSQLLNTPLGPLIMANIRDVADRVETEEMVRYLAYHDTLTGLANRVALDSELSHAISMSDRHGDNVGLVFLDLDDFKPVNDTYGHTTGDHVLREVANRLVGSVRDSDTVARIGGDEFVVLLPRLRRPTDLQGIAKSLVAEVNRPISVNGVEVCVTASCGLALHIRGEDAERFVTRADLSMYESRQRGVDGWELPAT